MRQSTTLDRKHIKQCFSTDGRRGPLSESQIKIVEIISIMVQQNVGSRFVFWFSTLQC